MEQYKIYSVNGPVVKVTGGRGLAMWVVSSSSVK